jgi:acyl carrier protein
MTSEVVETAIRRFILDRFPIARPRDISNHDLLLEKGILDSLGILDVVTFVESEFNVAVDDEDLLPENFESIHAMTGFVQAKKGQLLE